MGGHLGVRRVEDRLVPVGPGDARAQVVGDQDRGCPAQNANARTWAPSQWGSSWPRGHLRVRVVLRAQHRDEQLGLPDLAGVGVGDRDGLAREVDEHLLAGAVVLPQDEVQAPGVRPVLLGEPGVPEAIGAALPVLGPEQLEGDALAPQLAMDDRPVGDGRWSGEGARAARPYRRPSRSRSSRSGGSGQPRPAFGRPHDVAADGGAGQACRDAGLARAQALGEAEPQGFSDLAHGSTGTGHRHLSWGGVNAFQASVPGPGRLMPALLPTTSRGGGHYP